MRLLQIWAAPLIACTVLLTFDGRAATQVADGARPGASIRELSSTELSSARGGSWYWCCEPQGGQQCSYTTPTLVFICTEYKIGDYCAFYDWDGPSNNDACKQLHTNPASSCTSPMPVGYCVKFKYKICQYLSGNITCWDFGTLERGEREYCDQRIVPQNWQCPGWPYN
jgi:hypothetical protein